MCVRNKNVSEEYICYRLYIIYRYIYSTYIIIILFPVYTLCVCMYVYDNNNDWAKRKAYFFAFACMDFIVFIMLFVTWLTHMAIYCIFMCTNTDMSIGFTFKVPPSRVCVRDRPKCGDGGFTGIFTTKICRLLTMIVCRYLDGCQTVQNPRNGGELNIHGLVSGVTTTRKVYLGLAKFHRI